MMRSKIIGITGGSGTGKSYISGILRKDGIPVFDADKIGHEIFRENLNCKNEIIEYFGKDVMTNLEIDRKKLGKIVFSDREKLAKLNEISHKYILESIYNKIDLSKAEICAADGALLIESGMKCDVMIGVLAAYDIRLKRIMLRDGIDEKAARRRLDAQKDDDFYRENCDFVICNNSGEPDIQKIEDIIKGLKNEKNN